MSRWFSRPLALAVALLALVALLGGLQYRWLGEVSAAERDRMRAHLRQCATDIAAGFDAEVTRAFLSFQVVPGRFDGDPAAALASSYDTWTQTAAAPAIVSGVYLITAGHDNESAAIAQFDPSTRVLTDIAWPPHLAAWRQRAMHADEHGRSASVLMADPIDAGLPALAIPIPELKMVGSGDRMAFMPDLSRPGRLILLTFDRQRVRDDLLGASRPTTSCPSRHPMTATSSTRLRRTGGR
jgi:hypothetical protein